MQFVIQRSDLILFALLLLPGPAAHGQITAAVAANVQPAMEEMRAAFLQGTGVALEPVYGSSGKLATQIRGGAPFHVFVSADMGFPDSLHRWNLAESKPEVYAYGTLVLWTTRRLDLSTGLKVLADPAVRKISLADPRLAPYGKEAVRALRRAGLFEKAEGRLVYGENVSQVGQHVLSGNADAGFTAKSLVVAGPAAGKGAWVEVDTALYRPIAQGVVVTRRGAEEYPEASRKFLAWMRSEPARAILSRYGYSLPGPPGDR
jgi:molybdate transport system substrate-binding protein